MAHQHRHAVEAVVFRGDNEGFAYAIPVERAVKQRFGGVAVRVLIGPVTLALEACGNGVVAQRLFDQSFFRQLLVALHHVANAHRHQQALFEYRAALLGITFILLRVLVFAVAEGFIRPRQRHFQLAFIIDFLIDTAAQYGHIHRLDLHT